LTRPVDPNSTCRYHIRGAQGVLDLVVTYDVLGNFSTDAIWKELERRFPLSPTTPPTIGIYQEGDRIISVSVSGIGTDLS
jgi:hypothetical protein